MQDAWRDNWQPRNVFPSSRPATSVLGVSLAINPLENRWPIKSCVQGEPPLINADCQGASLMYFSFKRKCIKRSSFWVFFISFALFNVSGGGKKAPKWRQSANERFLILPVFMCKDVYLHRGLINQAGRLCKVQEMFRCEADVLTDFKMSEFALIWSRITPLILADCMLKGVCETWHQKKWMCCRPVCLKEKGQFT